MFRNKKTVDGILARLTSMMADLEGLEGTLKRDNEVRSEKISTLVYERQEADEEIRRAIAVHGKLKALIS